MNTNERINLLDDAQCKLSEAIELIQTALKGTEYESHAEAYILGHLENWIDAHSSFNMGVQQYMDALIDEDISEIEE
jgi:oligoribonuclease (3'-5' exoribonuclease)